MSQAIRLNDLSKQGPFGRTKLFDFIRRGMLPARKVDGVTFVLVEDWTAFLNHAPPVEEARREQAAAHAA